MSLAINIPDGYKKVRWSEVENLDTIFILGVKFEDGEWNPFAYGPHVVVDQERRQCKNYAKGFLFFHSTEDLLVKE